MATAKFIKIGDISINRDHISYINYNSSVRYMNDENIPHSEKVIIIHMISDDEHFTFRESKYNLEKLRTYLKYHTAETEYVEVAE